MIICIENCVMAGFVLKDLLQNESLINAFNKETLWQSAGSTHSYIMFEKLLESYEIMIMKTFWSIFGPFGVNVVENFFENLSSKRLFLTVSESFCACCFCRLHVSYS